MPDLSHIELPTIVYKDGGVWPGPRHPDGRHTTYSIRGCETHEQVAAALAEGWSLTSEEACWGWSVHEPKAAEPEPEPAPIPDDDAPPTREEMLAQAALLGLRVDRRWSDETLLAKVNAAMTPAPDDPI